MKSSFVPRRRLLRVIYGGGGCYYVPRAYSIDLTAPSNTSQEKSRGKDREPLTDADGIREASLSLNLICASLQLLPVHLSTLIGDHNMPATQLCLKYVLKVMVWFLGIFQLKAPMLAADCVAFFLRFLKTLTHTQHQDFQCGCQLHNNSRKLQQKSFFFFFSPKTFQGYVVAHSQVN